MENLIVPYSLQLKLEGFVPRMKANPHYPLVIVEYPRQHLEIIRRPFFKSAFRRKGTAQTEKNSTSTESIVDNQNIQTAPEPQKSTANKSLYDNQIESPEKQDGGRRSFFERVLISKSITHASPSSSFSESIMNKQADSMEQQIQNNRRLSSESVIMIDEFAPASAVEIVSEGIEGEQVLLFNEQDHPWIFSNLSAPTSPVQSSSKSIEDEQAMDAASNSTSDSSVTSAPIQYRISIEPFNAMDASNNSTSNSVTSVSIQCRGSIEPFNDTILNPVIQSKNEMPVFNTSIICKDNFQAVTSFSAFAESVKGEEDRTVTVEYNEQHFGGNAGPSLEGCCISAQGSHTKTNSKENIVDEPAYTVEIEKELEYGEKFPRSASADASPNVKKRLGGN